jgi:hypothetical protein
VNLDRIPAASRIARVADVVAVEDPVGLEDPGGDLREVPRRSATRASVLSGEQDALLGAVREVQLERFARELLSGVEIASRQAEQGQAVERAGLGIPFPRLARSQQGLLVASPRVACGVAVRTRRPRSTSARAPRTKAPSGIPRA